MNQLVRRALIGIALGVLLYAAAVLFMDVDRLRGSLAGFSWSALGASLTRTAIGIQ